MWLSDDGLAVLKSLIKVDNYSQLTKILLMSGGAFLKKMSLVLMALMLFVFASASNSSLCEDSLVHQINQNASSEADSSLKAPEADPTNATTIAPRLEYIWSIEGIETDRITLALHQQGRDLFGQTKYEPESGDAWNGEVVGLISENEVVLAITALVGGRQASILLEGIFANESMKGRFFKEMEGQISDRGTFQAVWINPDISSYEPAKIKATPSYATNISAPAITDLASQQKTRYHDIHQDADRILTGVGDISQIPIGMGGSGLP
jgi:hypothetical protein